jgi:invasion protein IalB
VALFQLDENTLAEARNRQELNVVVRMNNGLSFTFTILLAGFSASLAKVVQ